MEDLEICKRIAEIEGIDAKTMPYSKKILYAKYDKEGVRTPYNPLTDDVLITRLIKKYILSYRRDAFITVEERTIMHYFRAFNGKEQRGIDYNKTACLAIIEANS